MNLPDEIVQLIFGYLTFDEVSKTRLVCKQFNSLGGSLLNHGFKKVRNFHGNCLKEIKDALPRRESERRKHALYPRHDVLQAVETRLSLLSMTYGRLIQGGRCCFIPGKVLDEIFRILQTVRKHDAPMPNTVNLLQEMRDISSMAMEHFDEFILPDIDTVSRRSLFMNQETGATNITRIVDAQPFYIGSLPIAESPDRPVVFQESRLKSLKVNQERRIVSLLKAKVAKQSRVIRQMTTRQQQLENITSTLTQAFNELGGQLSEVVKQVNTHQSLLEARSKDPATLLLHPGTSGELNNNNNVILKTDVLAEPVLSPTGKFAEKRRFNDDTQTNEDILKKRLKY